MMHSSERWVHQTVTIAIGFLMWTMFLANIGFGVILPTLPFLSRHIGATPFEMGLALSVFAIAQLLSSSIWGILSDKAGRRPILIIGIVGYGLSSALLGLAPNIALLLVLRFLGGAMAAAVFPSTQALAADWTEPRDRARIMGYMGSMNGIGFIIGPPVGSLLYAFGVEIPFLAVGILSVINGLLALWMLPSGRTATQSGEIVKQTTRTEKRFATLIQSIMDVRIAPFLLGTLVFSIADACIASTLAYYITGHLHSTQAATGWAFMINGAMGALIQITLLNKIHSRFGETVTILIGFSFGAIGYFVLGLSNVISFAFLGICILACCRGFAFPSISAAISVRVAAGLQGTSFGSQQTANSLGRTVGPIIAGWLFSMQERFPYLFSSALMVLMLVGYFIWSRGIKGEHSLDLQKR